MGIATGEAELRDGDYFGAVLNRAAKSRLVREVAAMARGRDVEVFTTFCESHTSQIPFHVIARLLRVAFGVEGLDTRVARDGLRDRIANADPEDLLLLGPPGRAR
jgi:predicted ATPase